MHPTFLSHRSLRLVRTLTLAGLLALVPAFGSLAAEARWTPLPGAAARPAAGAPLDADGLVTLALQFSGTPDAALGAYRTVLGRWSAEFGASTAASLAPGPRAEALLEFLHTKLTTYQTYQTRLDTLLDRGTYNCVSSALAYMILGRAAGLDIQAVATKDHAFALVRLPGGPDVDVETTTKFGYDPGTKTGFTDSFGRTGFAYVPPGHYSDRRTIGDRQLLGLLIQNRMSDFQRAGTPEEAVGPAIDRWVVEGSPEAFKTLVDGFVNAASKLNGRQEYLKGLDLVDRMVTWTGPIPEAAQLVLAFVNNQVNRLLDRQDWAGAQALVMSWKNKGLLTSDQAVQTQGIISDRQLAVSVKTLPAAQAALQIEGAFAQGQIPAARRQEMLTFVYGQEVQRLAANQGPEAAWRYLVGLPAEVRAFPALVKAQEVYAYNWSVEVHNRFAQAWNAGNRDQARQGLKDALALLPDSALLKKDLVLSQGP